MTITTLTTTKTIKLHSYPGFVWVEYVGYSLRNLIIRKKAFSSIFGKNPQIEKLEDAWALVKNEKNRGFWSSPDQLKWYREHTYGEYPRPSDKIKEYSNAHIIQVLDGKDFSGVVFGHEYDGLVYDLDGAPVNRILSFDAAEYTFKNLKALAAKLSKYPEVIEAKYYAEHCFECGAGVKFTAKLTQKRLESLIKDNGWMSHECYGKPVRKLFPCLEEHFDTD